MIKSTVLAVASILESGFPPSSEQAKQEFFDKRHDGHKFIKIGLNKVFHTDTSNKFIQPKVSCIQRNLGLENL